MRISETVGLPAPVPDWVGLAVRIDADRDGGGPGGRGPTDLLLASARGGDRLWDDFAPSRDPLACCFTSKVRYRLGGVDQVVVATPMDERTATLRELIAGDHPCPIRYELAAGPTRDRLRAFGTVVLREPAPDADRTTRFRPPVGGRTVGAVRRSVYRLMQGPPPAGAAR